LGVLSTLGVGEYKGKGGNRKKGYGDVVPGGGTAYNLWRALGEEGLKLLTKPRKRVRGTRGF